MKYCPYCGAGLDDDMAFCPKCGRAYKGAVSEEMSAVPTASTHAEAATAASKKGRKPLWIAAAAVIATIAVVLCVVCLLPRGGEELPDSEPLESALPAAPAVANILDDKETLASLSNSVLMLECYDQGNELFATGSGFVAYRDDIIVTNYHVVADGVCSVKALSEEGKTMKVAGVVAYNKDMDVAILKMAEPGGIVPLTVGNSDEVAKGDTVIAIGSPLGLINSVSDGIVSGFLSDGEVQNIQFTAAISHGSSGGALFTKSGEVIGITAGCFVDGQSLNIAVPISVVNKLWEGADGEVSMSMQQFGEVTKQVYTVAEVLKNIERLNGRLIMVEGYVSTSLYVRDDTPSDNFTEWSKRTDTKDYFLASSPEETLGADIRISKSDQLSDEQVAVLDYETDRVDGFETLYVRTTKRDENNSMLWDVTLLPRQRVVLRCRVSLVPSEDTASGYAIAVDLATLAG